MKKESMLADSPARQLSVRQLRYFVAVADHRSFRRAAERLSVSQPPITKQIQALERTLGVPLLSRSRRRFALTPAGEAFHMEARMLLAGLDRACSTIRGLHGSRMRTFTIGMADDFVYGPHLDRLLASADALGIGIDTTVALSPSLELQVAHGIVDAALLNLPLVGDAAGLVIRPLPPSRICVLVPRKHPLARLSRVRPAMLEGLPLISCPDKPPNAFARQCEKMFVMHGVTPNIVCRTTSTVIGELLAERGMGIGLATEYSVRRHNPRLKLIPVESEESVYPHAAVYRADRGNEDLLALLASLETGGVNTRKARRAGG